MIKRGIKYVIPLIAIAVLFIGCRINNSNNDVIETRNNPVSYVDKDFIIKYIGDVFLEPKNNNGIHYYWVGEESIASMGCIIDDVGWRADIYKIVTDYRPKTLFHSNEKGWTTREDNFGMKKTLTWNGIEGELQYMYYDAPDKEMEYQQIYYDDKYSCSGEWYDEDAGLVYSLNCISPKTEELTPELFFTGKQWNPKYIDVLYEASDENSCRDMSDPDGDGLVNAYEYWYDCDPNNPDTDGDGLPDGFEEYATGLDTLKKSTKDGIPDAEYDHDKDGLTTLEEYNHGTDPCGKDTDTDGFTDGEEVKVYGTNPTVSDTDNDGVDERLEIQSGLDPLNPKTYGYPDNEHKLMVRFDEDSRAMSRINEESEDYKMSFSLEGTGNIAKDIYAVKYTNPDDGNNDATLYPAVSIIYKGGGVIESVTVSFKISDENISEEDTNEEGVNEEDTNDDTLSINSYGLGRYCIYYDDGKVQRPLATTIDKDTNTLTATATGVGVFTVGCTE